MGKKHEPRGAEASDLSEVKEPLALTIVLAVQQHEFRQTVLAWLKTFDEAIIKYGIYVIVAAIEDMCGRALDPLNLEQIADGSSADRAVLAMRDKKFGAFSREVVEFSVAHADVTMARHLPLAFRPDVYRAHPRLAQAIFASVHAKVAELLSDVPDSKKQGRSIMSRIHTSKTGHLIEEISRLPKREHERVVRYLKEKFAETRRDKKVIFLARLLVLISELELVLDEPITIIELKEWFEITDKDFSKTPHHRIRFLKMVAEYFHTLAGIEKGDLETLKKLWGVS